MAVIPTQYPIQIPHPIHPELTHCDTSHPYFSLKNATPSQKLYLKQYFDYGKELVLNGAPIKSSIPNKNFNKFIKKVLVENINDKFDNVIVISSIEGTGKTTFMFWIAAALSYFMDFKFDVRTHFTYNLKDFNDLMKAHKFQVVCLDEGTKAFYKRNSQEALQKTSITLLTASRKRYNTTLICSPRFEDLDEYIRGHRVYINLKIVQRSWAEVYVKKFDEREDPWSEDDYKKQRKVMPKGNLWPGGMIYCPPIPPSIAVEYDLLAEENYLESDIIEETMAKSQLFGIWFTRWIRDNLGGNNWDNYLKYYEINHKKIRNPFGYQQIEKMIKDSSGGKFEISDAYVRELAESVTPPVIETDNNE